MSDTTITEEADALFEAMVEIGLFFESMNEFVRILQQNAPNNNPATIIMKRTIGSCFFAARDAIMNPILALAPQLQASDSDIGELPSSPQQHALTDRNHLHVRATMMERLDMEPDPGPFPSIAALVRACRHLRQLQTLLAMQRRPELAIEAAPLVSQLTNRVAIEIGLFELGRHTDKPEGVSALRELFGFANPADVRPLVSVPRPEDMPAASER